MVIINKRRAFTLTEVMVVTFIIGLIGAFSIPAYNSLVEKNQVKSAVLNLQLIHSANKILYSKTGKYLQGSSYPLGINDIESELGIVIQNKANMTYSYTYNSSTDWFCTALSSDNSYTIKVDQNIISSSNPSCSAGTCPGLD